MSQRFMEELGKQQWRQSRLSAYARLSTSPEVFLPFDEAEEVYSKETIPLVNRDDCDDGSQDEGWGLRGGYVWARSTIAQRTRLMRMLVFVILFFAGLPFVVRWVIDRLPHDTPAQRLTFGAGVLASECCSQTAAFLPQSIRPIQAHGPFTDEAMEQWIAHGIVLPALDFSRHVRIDALTTWVNGSDPRHQANRELYSHDEHRVNGGPAETKDSHDDAPSTDDEKEKVKAGMTSAALQNTDNRFRDLNELQYSVRSTRLSLLHHLGTHHILSTDFWASDKPPEDVQDHVFGQRRGQVPQWLDTQSPFVAFGNQTLKRTPAVRVHHDWQTFVPFDGHTDAERWREQRLPTFASTAAEAVAGINVPGLSEIFFLGSDDMFLTANLTTADFYTPLFGPVMHIDNNYYFYGRKDAMTGTESTGMEYTVTLLRDRFGTPGFGYPAHIQKAMVQPLVLESRLIWRAAFEEASGRRFRGDGRTVNSHMLTYGMLVERHREALLWSFLVAKIDKDGDGVLDDDELGSALQQMGAQNISSDVSVRLPERDSNRATFRQRALDAVRFPNGLATEHQFSSLDGYPYVSPLHKYSQTTGLRFRDLPPSLQATPTMHAKQFTAEYCQVQLLHCWPRNDRAVPLRTTNDILKRFAFETRDCGDCLIMHLVGRSGKKGLQAFLPSANSTFPTHAVDRKSDHVDRDASATAPATAYHLPLTANYANTNFSLAAVMADNKLDNGQASDRRTFVLHLLTRYSYSIGTAPGGFEMLRTAYGAERQLNRLTVQTKAKKYAFLCINDDIVEDAPLVKQTMRNYFHAVWPGNSTRWPFEKP